MREVKLERLPKGRFRITGGIFSDPPTMAEVFYGPQPQKKPVVESKSSLGELFYGSKDDQSQ